MRKKNNATCHPDRPAWGHGLCHKCWARQYRQRPSKKEYDKKYYIENKEKILKYQHKYYKNNKEEIAERQVWCHRKNRFGIGREDFLLLIKKQNNKCPICHAKLDYNGAQKKFTIKNTCLDHDHKTGKVRGILCWYCNVKILPIIEEHNDLIDRARAYLFETAK